MSVKHSFDKQHAAGVTRRSFLQTISLAGAVVGFGGGASALIAESSRRVADRRGKKITLLEDGGFTGSAWGWQFTQGAMIDRASGHRAANQSMGAVHVETTSGDYARFMVLGPVGGKKYTISGWVKTEAVVSQEEGAGAYFAASQFEFQGRPTEFTVDGRQATEHRLGNLTGTQAWQRFSQTVTCLDTTSWFEVVVGIYRAGGQAWFSGLTFVEGEEGAELSQTMLPHEAAMLAHQTAVGSSKRRRPHAAVLNESGLPIRGTTTDPLRLTALLKQTHDVTMISAAQLANEKLLSRNNFDLLVLPYGETFPVAAKETVLAFLADGGDLFTTGGYAFESPVTEHNGQWRFVDDVLRDAPTGRNLLAQIGADERWKASSAEFCSTNPSEEGTKYTATVRIPSSLREKTATWMFDLPAQGEGRQFFFKASWRANGVEATPNGQAFIGVEQLTAEGNPAYAARMTFEEVRGGKDWHAVERLFYLVRECVTLRVWFGLQNATGTVQVEEVRLEERPDQVRINTALGWPEDSLRVKELQLGLFDADYRLKRVEGLRSIARGHERSVESSLKAEGYAASGVVGMNAARWFPILEAVDGSGRSRGAAGALMHNYNGEYARSSWAFFGISNHDVFALGCDAGLAAFQTAARALTLKSFLHNLETNYATYREGEEVRLRVLASNYGLRERKLKVALKILDGGKVSFETTREVSAEAGETKVLEVAWKLQKLDAPQCRVMAELIHDGAVIDTMESAFNVWKQETLRSGMRFEFRENYFQVNGRSVFLQGTDDYLHTFLDQDENPGTWRADAQGCRDSAIDVYENLMGLRGPQQRPPEAWWRWIDAMLLNTQHVGGIFFPGMLVFSNTAVSDAGLAEQKAYVRAFSERYRDAAGIMYYLNGDLELHDPNLPDLQRLYNDFLLKKYGGDEKLKEAWKISPPEAPIGSLKIHRGSTAWKDVRTRDDFQFRTELVRRWLNAMHASIREVDTTHPVTAEFYQQPVSGIDLLTALGNLELANFGYFNEKDDDYDRFPQICRFLDQSMRGKGINIGEFGVKTHPAWNDTGYYIEARTEEYEQKYFLSLSHYGFALGASKIQNWCWKYPSDLTFEWGINYPNELVPRDARAFYRNSGIMFRMLRPRYEASDTVVLLASDSRMGGEGRRIVEGQLSAIRLLLDANVRFGTLTDEFIGELPAGVKTIFYPLPYSPDDATLDRLKQFVRNGGQLYLSGDISYDATRQRTRFDRLRELCGIEVVSERYSHFEYGAYGITTKPKGGGWPKYDAAPSLIVRPAGAKVLLADVEGHPVVTEFALGKGRVVLSLDPVELHGDPRYQPYGPAFYGALLRQFASVRESVNSVHGAVHCIRVPQQDDRHVNILVNYGTERDVISLPILQGKLELSLGSRLPGVAVSGSHGVQAVESSGDVRENGRSLVSSNLHAMVIGFGYEPLATARRILILPMGTGTMTLHTKHAFKHPTVLMGEISDGRWKQYATPAIDSKENGITLTVTDGIALSMLLLCEEEDRSATIREMETWMHTPWKLEERR